MPSASMLRANSKLRTRLGNDGVAFLEYATGALLRLLPHVEVSRWEEADGWREPGCAWTSAERTEIRIVLTLGEKGQAAARSLTGTVRRRTLPILGGVAGSTLDTREYDLCRLVAGRLLELLGRLPTLDASSLQTLRNAFDEFVVASHVQTHHKAELPVTALFAALHELSEQSYENKSLAFGCILEPTRRAGSAAARFPSDFLHSKKYKALSDGYRTAYVVSTDGYVTDFVDLGRFAPAPLTDKHYFPDWAEPVARASRNGRCGIGLSRQGDILIFDDGSLRLTYRYGQWQYWNHSHLVRLLRDRARAQRVPVDILGRVVGSIYRAAIDVSFRRSGGMFVILHNRNSLRHLVRLGDAISDAKKRSEPDREFDNLFDGRKIQSLPRSVVSELASLDGAVVLANSGEVLAYGAILQPKKKGRLHGTEGSRTKAAIGASNYGLTVKISSDGQISFYYEGAQFIRV
jgi:hypothetical protein